MASSQANAAITVPKTVRLFDALPLPPALLGLLVAGGYYLVFLVWAAAFGWIAAMRAAGIAPWASVEFRFELLNAALVGYLAAAIAYGLRQATSDLRDLRPALRLPDAEFEESLRALVRFERGSLVFWSVFGIAVGLCFPFTSVYWPGERPAFGTLILSWNLLKLAVQAWFVTLAIFTVVAVATRFSRLGREHARVDLLDLSPLAPLVRHGLRSVLLFMLFSVLLSFNYFAPWPGDLAWGTIIGLSVVAGIVLLLPVRGVHARMLQTKQEALREVNAAIRAESGHVLRAAPGQGSSDARLGNLVAYRGLLDSASTWPFDTAAYLRFGLYVSLGLGSWLGGALVERALDLALG